MLLILLGAAAVLVFLFCFSHPKITVKYDGSLSVYARLWFVKINVSKLALRPKKRKKTKIIHFDGGTFGEFPEKENRRKHKEKSAEKKSSAKSKSRNAEQKKDEKSIAETLGTIAELLSEISEPLKKAFGIEIKKLRLTAAAENAADTAVLFGHMNTAAGTLIYVCEQFPMFSADAENIGVYSDFLSSEPSADAEIAVTVSVRHVLACAFKSLIKYIKIK